MQPTDKLIAGLQILKAYAPDMEPTSTHRTMRILEVQREEFEDLSAEDIEKLKALGWWTNGHYLWGF